MGEDDQLRKRLVQRIEEQLLSAMTGTPAGSNRSAEPFTLAHLQNTIASMPPKETWLSSRLFPSDAAFCVSGSGENFTCAHPGFWSHVIDAERKLESQQRVSLFGRVTDRIVEIDAWAEDEPATAAWRRAFWDRLREAVEVAMVPLPDWLRSPPKFSKHG
jgi:hypothetical protein